MDKVQRAEGQIELQCEVEKFFNTWTRESNLVSEWCPHRYTKVELHEGAHWHATGAVQTWHYVHDGHHEFVKIRVAEIDETNKSVNYEYIDAHILRNYYKSFKSKFQVISKGDGGCFVKWSFDYEKKTQDAPDADIYIDFLLGCAKDMDSHLCTA